MTVEKNPVQIEELNIVRAPGFDTTGFELRDLSAGINLIHGPNASGKTTTAEAIEKVLWPETTDGQEQLVGHLSVDGEQWRVDVRNGQAEYQRDGQEATAPTLPSADQRDRYRLSLHDLLQEETRNESFAKTIERESAGGYDLAAAHAELGYTDSSTTRRAGVYKDAKSAVETWRDERDDAKELEKERQRLTRLQNELDEARQARAEEEALDQAIAYCEAKSDYEEAKNERDEFPDELEQIDGDELKQVEELDNKIEEWAEKQANAEEKKETADQTLDEADLPDEGVADGVIERLKHRRDALDECESRKEELNEELAGAKEQRQIAREEIPLDIEREELAELEPGSWTDIFEFVQTAERVQAQRQQRETIKQWADTDEEPETEAELSTLERGSKALEEWLMAGAEPDSPTGDRAALRVGAASGGVVALIGTALGLLVDPLLFSVILLAVIPVGYGYYQQGTQETTTDTGDRDSHQKSFDQTGLAPPASWTEDEVRNRLMEIYQQIAEYKVTEERHQKRDTLLAEQDVDSLKEALEEKRKELREQIGVAPETTDIELAVIVRRVLDWQEAHDEVVGLQSELGEVTDNLGEARSTLQTELGEYGYEEVEDAATATQYIRDLEQRRTDHENATRDLVEAEETIQEAKEKLADFRAEQEDIFTEVGLEVGERDELEALCEQVDDYEEAKEEVNRTEAVLETEREKLEELPAYEPALKQKELPELREERRQAQETADQYDDLQQEISDIEADIRDAKSDDAVEEAIREKDRALDALKEQLHEDYAAMVGDVLVEHVQEQTIEASRPAVFQRANELLATITHGRYELKLADGEQTFRAFDTAKQKGFALDELSSGTRVQVLVAVRLAFVEQQEQRAQLPIILDETLANTDDLRAEVLIESMIELAKDGRQIFYFTAQGDEVAKWHDALTEASDVESTMIDLAEARDLDEGVQTPDLDRIEPFTLNPPDPAGHDHESYGEVLDVGTFNPYNGAGTAHIWYVVEDIDILHDLLQTGIERWGQLQNLLERGQTDLIPADAATLDEIQQNGAALEEFTEAWQIGRGDPVDRAVLENSGAVSDTFIDRVTALAEDLGGDGKQLVEALYDGEVNRFRENKTEELEEYLRANGYVVAREPLDDDTIRVRMIERLIDEGVPREQAVESANNILARVTQE